jgi:Tfp pilus assembly protein FimT
MAMARAVARRRARVMRLRSERGITFPDVAASLVVMSVLLASSTPILSEILAQYHLRGATQAFYAELQQARFAAVMENTTYRVYAVDGTPVFKIHDDKNHNDREDDGEVTTLTLERETPGVVLSSQDTVTFLPNGTALTYGAFTLTSSSGRTKTVVVSAGGRIRTD